MDLLDNIFWLFTDTEYDSAEDFNFAISQYQDENEENNWKPTQIILESSTLNIVFRAWIEENSLAENETLLEDADFFDDETRSEFGLYEADIMANFKADNGKNFSALELMYKIDQQLKEKELGDDHIFESLGELENENNIPKFYLFCGS